MGCSAELGEALEVGGGERGGVEGLEAGGAVVEGGGAVDFGCGCWRGGGGRGEGAFRRHCLWGRFIRRFVGRRESFGVRAEGKR